jgi:hypothetical protein
MASKATLISLLVAIFAIITTFIATDLPARIFKEGYYILSASFGYPYQAILDGCEGPGEFEYGVYAVKLKPGHSISAHSAAIGTDIEAYFIGFRPHNTFFDMESIFYYTKDVNEELFKAIIADRGVYLVACSKLQTDFDLDPYTDTILEGRQPFPDRAKENDEGEAMD